MSPPADGDYLVTWSEFAAKHYQAGTHSYYFGFAACAWFAHPVALVCAGLWVVAILYRREFLSRANAALATIKD